MSGIDISFENLRYEVALQKSKNSSQGEFKTILNGLTGIAKHGEVTAIMGSSGAGKTSLLNILACRISNNDQTRLSGNFTANYQNYNSDFYNQFACYVMQEDILMQTMTPKESLEFAANLRLSGTKQEKESRVNKIIQDFRLEKCQNTFIGGPLIKGISGGERKRTSIAVDFVTDPSVIMLDEPTSGLDSFTAYLIIRILKDYAQRGKTVIFTIHQPSYDIYQMFDRLILLVQGKFIYQGPCNTAIDYFQKMNMNVPEFCNPSDFFMDIMHTQYHPETYNQRCELMFENYEKKLQNVVQKEFDDQSKSMIEANQFTTSGFEQFQQIAKRQWINTKRLPMLYQGRLAQTIFMGILMGIIYYKLDQTFEEVYNRNGAIFFLAVDQLMTPMQGVLLTFPSERKLFLKEENSKMYGAIPYYFGRVIFEIPLQAFFAVLISSICYFMIGLNQDSVDKFFILMLVLVIQSFTGAAIGLTIGSLFSDPKQASAMAPAFFLPMMLFSGFYKNRDSLVIWMQWFEFTSPVKYAFEALITNEYENKVYATIVNGVTVYRNPIQDLNLELGLWRAIYILAICGLVYRIISLIFIKTLVKKIQ